MDDEPTTYFASRLAARNFQDARSFASDMDFRFEALERGCHKAISRLSDISEADLDTLTRNAPQFGTGKVRIGGQYVSAKSRRATRVVVCPACLEEDVARSDLDPSMAVRGRIQWTLTPIRTCVDHGMALVTMVREMSQQVRHDWTKLISPMLPNLSGLTDRAIRRPPSKLETYLVDRLRGKGAQCWLDKLPFFVAEQTAQLFGSMALYGNAAARDLSDDQKYAAGDAGFEVVKDGPIGISSFLSNIDSSFASGRSVASPQLVYGRVYYRLNTLSQEPAFAEVLDIVTDHILHRFPLGPGDDVFGKPVEIRRFHSALTLAKRYRSTERRINDILGSSGFSLESRGSGQKALFDAGHAEIAVENALKSITLVEAQKRLGASASIMNIVLEAGFVKRHRTGQTFMGLKFQSDELDAFLASVMAESETVERSTSEMKSLSYTSAHTRCKIATIIQMIIDKKLPWVGRRVSSGGLASLLVYPDDVRAALGRSPIGGMSALEAGKQFHIAPSTLRALASRGIVQSQAVRHPLSGRIRLLFETVDLKNFNEKYVTLYNLSKASGRRLTAVRKQLDGLGIVPAPETDGLDSVFYRRPDIPPHF